MAHLASGTPRSWHTSHGARAPAPRGFAMDWSGTTPYTRGNGYCHRPPPVKGWGLGCHAVYARQFLGASPWTGVAPHRTRPPCPRCPRCPRRPRLGGHAEAVARRWRAVAGLSAPLCAALELTRRTRVVPSRATAPRAGPDRFFPLLSNSTKTHRPLRPRHIGHFDQESWHASVVAHFGRGTPQS